MNIFEKLLEIKTGNINISVSSIYIKSLDTEINYHYNKINHEIYINWLESNSLKIRKILEDTINKSYNQEKEKSKDILNSISKTKKPKVFLVYYSDNQDLVIIDSINIKPIRNKNLEILKLKVWQ